MGAYNLRINDIEIKKVLVLYKKSSYQIYSLPYLNLTHRRTRHNRIGHFKRAHVRHFESLAKIEQSLTAMGIRYKKIYRGTNVDFTGYDFIISVGGDGTFLEAAQQMTHQFILGVNSDPSWSVGRLCTATPENFCHILQRISAQKIRIRFYARMAMEIINNHAEKINSVNDILVCHRNPAAMSRYVLTVNGIEEEQRSSGIWISTAAGSTGAIHSAGGKIFPITNKQFQYKPRELYSGFKNVKYHLKGGQVTSRTIRITSLMKDGAVFVDGCHIRFPFPFGATIVISKSAQPLKVLTL